MVPISVQLYSLREASEKDFDAVLQRVAEIGFKGVEPFNLFGMTPTAFRDRVEELGMVVSSSHLPWANRADINAVADTLEALGLSRAAGGFMPDDFKDEAALERTIATTQGLVEALHGRNLELFLHNHWWEFATINGRTAYHELQDRVPQVKFELDTYWACNFGRNDPVAELRRIAHRTPYLHIKDGPLVEKAPMVAVGSGVVDVPAILGAADPATLEWAIVELDACATDMMAAIEQSYTYLTTHNLAHGNV